MGCIVSKLFLDFYICFIFTRPLRTAGSDVITLCYSAVKILLKVVLVKTVYLLHHHVIIAAIFQHSTHSHA